MCQKCILKTNIIVTKSIYNVPVYINSTNTIKMLITSHVGHKKIKYLYTFE